MVDGINLKMRVLWVTAHLVPYVARELGEKPSPFGGWIISMIDELKKDPDYEIAVVLCASVSARKIVISHDIRFYVCPTIGKNKGIGQQDLDDILKDFKPDLIHIEGNEYDIHRQFSVQNNVKKLVSLQGILSGYEPYQYGNLQVSDMIFSKKHVEAIPGLAMLVKKKSTFYKRLDTEKETIRHANVIMGRTSWDRAHSYWLNPDAPYVSCHRNLRPPFFSMQWNYDACEKHSIFVGNGYKPLKGLHFALKALAYLAREFPDVKLYVAGISPITASKTNIKHYGYSLYIENLIRSLKLEERVLFCGTLSAEEIANRMCACHVFLLPSLIENSPNSLAEAMTLGMPCVASYAGGVPDMALDKKEALLYRADDPELLAWNVKQLFDSREYCERLGQAARKHALFDHNSQNNAEIIKKTYAEMVR